MSDRAIRWVQDLGVADQREEDVLFALALAHDNGAAVVMRFADLALKAGLSSVETVRVLARLVERGLILEPHFDGFMHFTLALSSGVDGQADEQEAIAQ
jgi:CRP-like cAMP-binding protein